MWKDDRLRWKAAAGDVEAAPGAQGGGAQGGAAAARPRAARDRATAGAAAGAFGPGGIGSRVLGTVSPRVWLVVGYLSLLHIAVMVSFTRAPPDLARLCAGFQGVPGAGGLVLP